MSAFLRLDDNPSPQPQREGPENADTQKEKTRPTRPPAPRTSPIIIRASVTPAAPSVLVVLEDFLIGIDPNFEMSSGYLCTFIRVGFPWHHTAFSLAIPEARPQAVLAEVMATAELPLW